MSTKGLLCLLAVCTAVKFVGGLYLTKEAEKLLTERAKIEEERIMHKMLFERVD